MNVVSIESRRPAVGKIAKTVKSAHAQRPHLHCLWLKDSTDGRPHCVWVKDEAETAQARISIA